MWKIVLILMIMTSSTNGNSINGDFKTCNLQCSNEDDVTPRPTTTRTTTRSLLRGKAGPPGVKGEEGNVGMKGERGISCNRSEINQLYNRISQLETQLTNKLSKTEEVIQRNKLKLCGVLQHDKYSKSKRFVENSQITASSYCCGEDHAPYHGRLFSETGRGLWAANAKDGNQWIQVDLLDDVTIYSVVTQGRHRDHNQWVTSFTMSYKSHNSNHFRPIVDDDGEAKVFQGNEDKNTPVINIFPRPITARYFRINVVTWQSHISIRFDLLTC